MTHFHEGQEFHCTFSAGIAQVRTDDTAKTLSKRADDRLYLAKKAGRNRVYASEKKEVNDVDTT